MRDLLSSIEALGLPQANYVMRALIPAENQSSLRSLRIVRSIELSFDGAGDAIRATADIIDPLGRRAKKEHNRHSQAMNRLEEEAKQEQLAHLDEMNWLEEEAKRTAVGRARLDLALELAEHLDDSGPVLREIAEQALRGLIRGASALDTFEVKILEGPTDLESG
ncbi:MAG TPA: hypothetical protein VGG53_08100 [Mycobacterium sp.]|jgi:hypothetical protein|uniref:hypothetical protein n=1 Tax=Mycobacterium sp. TaxID=1785 RepID=UPI002F404752